jgi:RimJ/RimL family protein N-acetyltransferase
MDTARTLLPAEMELYRDHLLRLGAADRRLRFGATIGDAAIAAFVARISPWNTRIIARFNRRLEVIAAVQVSVADGPLAELAFSVDASERGQGLATALMDRALLSARNRGIGRVHTHCRAENQPMRRLARRAGMAIETDAGEAEGVLDLPAATPLTMARELWLEQAGFWDYALKASLRSAMPGPDTPHPHLQH